MCPVRFLFLEDLVDVDEEFSCDCDDGSLAAASGCDAFVEGFELRVEAGRVLGGFDEDPAYVAVAFFCDGAVEGSVARLMCARSETCV